MEISLEKLNIEVLITHPEYSRSEDERIISVTLLYDGEIISTNSDTFSVES